MLNFSAKFLYYATLVVGFITLFIHHIQTGASDSFIIILALVTLSSIRLRFPQLKYTIIIDFIVAIGAMIFLPKVEYLLVIVLFQSGINQLHLFLIFALLFHPEWQLLLLGILSYFTGFLLGRLRIKENDDITNQSFLRAQVYELETHTQNVTSTMLEDIQLATVAERARISREIHDNAGHDIIAAYMSFQTLGNFIEDEELKQMYDTTLNRLADGVEQIRDILHNIAPTELPGIETFKRVIDNSLLEVDFKVYGDTTDITPYIWSTLLVTLKEYLTNAAKYSKYPSVTIELDVGLHIIRLYLKNPVEKSNIVGNGRGIANLRYRAGAIGGNLSVNIKNEIFSMICVIPLQKPKSTKEV